MNSPYNPKVRLVRNLLAMRMVLSVEQMQTGKWNDHIEDIDEHLHGLGHDMKSIAARAADGLHRSLVLPRLLSGKTATRRRPAPRTALQG